MREAIRPDESVMVMMGPSPANYQNERCEVAGKSLIWRDLHGKHLIELKFQLMFHREGDVVYALYVPLFTGAKLEQFVSELIEHHDLPFKHLLET